MVFTIKDIENLSGIKAHTIRIWEQRYSFIKPQRSETNIRYYTNEELKIILNIALLNKHGYKISSIDKMTSEKMAESVMLLTDAEAKEDLVINELLNSMISYKIDEFENLLEKHVDQAGLESTILRIIFPFLQKVGVLWVTNHLNPAQEHLVSNVIRQKLISGIDQQKVKIATAKTICLFLPEGEYHELALLFVNYLMRHRGIKTIYAGCHTPFKDLDTIVNQYRPDFLYSHITSTKSSRFDEILNHLHKKFGNISTVISGRVTSNHTKKLPPNISLLRSPAEVKNFVDQLPVK